MYNAVQDNHDITIFTTGIIAIRKSSVHLLWNAPYLNNFKPDNPFKKAKRHTRIKATRFSTIIFASEEQTVQCAQFFHWFIISKLNLKTKITKGCS